MGIVKRVGKALLFFLIGLIALPIALLLLVLAIILLLVCCLGQIRYRVNAQVGDENTAHVEVSYFMWLIRFAFSYVGGEAKTRGRIAWVRIGEDRRQRKNRRRNKKTMKAEKARSEKKADAADAISIHKDKGIPSQARNDDAIRQDIPPPKIPTPIPDPVPEPDPEEKDSPGFIKQAKEILTYPDLKIIIGLGLRFLKKYINALKPKRLDISGVVGFDDPATTGWAMGAYEAAAGITGLRPHVRLLGSYHEKALRLDIKAHGRTRLGRLIWPFIWLYLQKPIRRLIHKHLLRKGD